MILFAVGVVLLSRKVAFAISDIPQRMNEGQRMMCERGEGIGFLSFSALQLESRLTSVGVRQQLDSHIQYLGSAERLTMYTI